MVNQIRFFIGFAPDHVTRFCRDNGVLGEAYSPFAIGGIVDNQAISALVHKYGARGRHRMAAGGPVGVPPDE